MDSDILHATSNSNDISSTKLPSKIDKSLPPIESTAQDTKLTKGYDIITKQKDKVTLGGSKVSGKEKLLDIHSQDEIIIDDEVKSSDDDESDNFGGVYCGPKEEKSSKVRSEQDSKKPSKASSNGGSVAKSASETNLSRNHSLKYSGGALHDDRNPASFDHTFSHHLNGQDDSQCKTKTKRKSLTKENSKRVFTIFD